eukprot:4009777-Pleurochrysis_carterae.AAC.3
MGRLKSPSSSDIKTGCDCRPRHHDASIEHDPNLWEEKERALHPQSCWCPNLTEKENMLHSGTC